MQPPQTILRAAWIAPMDAPLMRDGAVAVRAGRILAVGTWRDIEKSYPAVQAIDLEDSILLPGLINAHTHLELSLFRCGEAPAGTFTDWILTIPKRRPEADLATAVRAGIDQCLRFGVTCVGDIAQESGVVRRTLAQSPLRCVSYGETLGLGGLRWKFDALLAQSIDMSFSSPRLRIGLSPHAPYTVDLPGYEQCLKLAMEHGLPLATHLAESPDEQEFLETQSGPFRRLWETVGTWHDDIGLFPGSPIEMAHSIDLLDYPTLLAHVNYCTDAEVDLLSRGRASVVYCPRTHRYFGHPAHRWQEMLSRGINLAVGTDSCASSSDLNLVDELRLLRQIAPGIAAESLWEFVTVRAARALQWEQEIGTITAGKRADLVAFKAMSDRPLEMILQSDHRPTSVWIDGARVV